MPEQPQQEQAPQPNIPTININLTQNGMVISHVVAAMDENMMNQIVTQWLMAHPALLAEIAKQAAMAKQKELQIIQHIGATRND